jgi:hypothetical protein
MSKKRKPKPPPRTEVEEQVKLGREFMDRYEQTFRMLGKT